MAEILLFALTELFSFLVEVRNASDEGILAVIEFRLPETIGFYSYPTIVYFQSIDEILNALYKILSVLLSI